MIYQVYSAQALKLERILCELADSNWHPTTQTPPPIHCVGHT